MKKQFNENLFSSVLYLFLGVLLILINLTWFLPTRNSLRENISRLEAEAAEKARISVSAFIKEKRAELKTAAAYFSYPLDDQKNTFVIRRILREKSFTQITLLNKGGDEIFKINRIFSTPFLDLGNKSELPEFKEVMKTGKIYFSEIKFSYSYEPYLLVAVPASPVEGEIAGVAIGELNIRPMFDYIAGIKLGGYGKAYIVDKDGVLISHSDFSLVLKQRDYSFRKIISDVLSLQRAVVSNDDTYAYVNEDGVSVLAAASFIPEINSAVIFEEPRSEALRSLNRVKYFLLLVILLGLAVVFGLRKINVKLINAEKKIEKLREEYTAMMAHEMRAPIEGIRKVSEVLLEEKIKKDETVHDNFVRMIISNATVMLQLINDYLDVAKLKAGKLEISYTEFEFRFLKELS